MALTAPIEGTKTHLKALIVILLFCVISKRLSDTNFGIGDVVAGTTPMTTLRKPSHHFCNNKLHLDALATTGQFALHQL